MLKLMNLAGCRDLGGKRLGVGVALVASVLLLVGAPAARAGAWSADRPEVISLPALSRAYGFQSLSIRGNTAVLLTRFHSLELEEDSRRAVFDGLTIWLNGPIEKSWGRWLMLKADVDKTLAPLLAPLDRLAAEGFGVVVLDAGHGGEDRGASMSSQGVEEKQLTLDLARTVRDILTRYQVEVRLTRADDRQVTLDNRNGLARAWRADLFVSLHFNSAANARPSGIETYILPPAGFSSTADASSGASDRIACPGNRHDAANMVLGYMLHKSVLKYARGGDRGLRRGRFVVLRNADCPAALVECGFLSNPREQQKILNRTYRDDLARGLAEGLLTYLNAVKRAHQLNP